MTIKQPSPKHQAQLDTQQELQREVTRETLSWYCAARIDLLREMRDDALRSGSNESGPFVIHLEAKILALQEIQALIITEAEQAEEDARDE